MDNETMDNIRINATKRTPEVDFDFGKNVFTLRGEAYSEDIIAFFEPIQESLETHLSDQDGAQIQFNCELIYFNSATASVIVNLFETLDEAAKAGNHVVITWAYEEGDDSMEELGEEFAEDLEHATLKMNVQEM